MGDFVSAIGAGVSGLVGGSINALGVAFNTIVAQLQAWLPGPLFPATLIIAGFLVLRFVLRR